ncbi:protein kintoun [Austrofundulus limnaeus]|uniref:Protein kintoun n=1 Tax=Austrofundulus limnaeus TaxID=52670 RepID=A0A2I4BQ08_AUSLI|nr:PREDICTED: protein kintoun [Austrofundulus limnaeus]
MAKQFGEKLSELNLSSDELDRLSQAVRDEKFKQMFCDYAREISDPANRETYEREIKLLEEERGNSVEFVRPAPWRVLRTTAGGEKCFINICGSENVDKPDCRSAVSKDGRRGQRLSLPHGLLPGRQNIDPKGNKHVIYDVIFHPDTLHMAALDKDFNDVVNNTAIDGIQKAFKVVLDKKHVREIKSEYKGTPQACVIRKPLPGYEAKETPEQPDPLAFPHPDAAKPSESGSSVQIQPPAEPSYTLKYRSVVDLQDYVGSRDSAPRPKEVVVVVDLPLLTSVGDSDTSLVVKGKILQLESKRPAYRLELPLAYPVDEENAEAKFNTQRRQLTVTLPVQPSSRASFCLQPGQRGRGMQEEKCQEPERKDNECEEQERVDEETSDEAPEERREELTKRTKQSRGHEKTVEDSWDRSAAQRGCCFLGDNPVLKETTADDNRFDASSKTEYQHIFTSAEHLSLTEEDREPKEASTSESASEETTEGGPESGQMTVTDVTNESNRRDLSVDALKPKNNVAGEGDLPAEQVLQTPEPDRMPSATLREVDADGNETVISDHSTSAGFTFQNKLMYELD